jgi:6-pyruvoyl-tetrahydropterin synthase
METLYLLRHKFSAGHALADCSDRPHGHDYEVEIAFRDFPKLAMVGLITATNEIHNRNLPEMLPGIPPTCAGIAGWLFERLRFTVPVVRVTVWQSGFEGAEVTETDV